MTKKTINSLREISDTVWELLKFCFRFFIVMIDASITIILLVGSFISFILLYKLFPELFTHLINALEPVFRLLLTIFKTLWWLAFILCIGYLIFNVAIFLINSGSKSKARREQRREKFLDDLAIKMNKKLKKK